MRIISKIAPALLAVGAIALAGCGPARNVDGLGGSCYADVKGNYADVYHQNNAAVVGAKAGKSTATGYLGLVNIGDASIESAAKAGSITKISYVDYHTTNILGIIKTYTVVVHGE
jgi:hypothetical protein